MLQRMFGICLKHSVGLPGQIGLQYLTTKTIIHTNFSVTSQRNLHGRSKLEVLPCPDLQSLGQDAVR